MILDLPMNTEITPPIGKIKLTQDLPLDKKHGAKAGRVFDLIRTKGPMRRSAALFFFIGDAGEECAAYGSECEELE